jgi:phytoene dehydrogenase-like protein
MARVKIDVSSKRDVLGPWDEPIKKTVRDAMPGAKPSFTMLPMGRAALVVLWPGFKGRDVTERQEQVHDTVAELGDDALDRITMIVALTPEEARRGDD